MKILKKKYDRGEITFEYINLLIGQFILLLEITKLK